MLFPASAPRDPLAADANGATADAAMLAALPPARRRRCAFAIIPPSGSLRAAAVPCPEPAQYSITGKDYCPTHARAKLAAHRALKMNHQPQRAHAISRQPKREPTPITVITATALLAAVALLPSSRAATARAQDDWRQWPDAGALREALIAGIPRAQRDANLYTLAPLLEAGQSVQWLGPAAAYEPLAGVVRLTLTDNKRHRAWTLRAAEVTSGAPVLQHSDGSILIVIDRMPGLRRVIALDQYRPHADGTMRRVRRVYHLPPPGKRGPGGYFYLDVRPNTPNFQLRPTPTPPPEQTP